MLLAVPWCTITALEQLIKIAKTQCHYMYSCPACRGLGMQVQGMQGQGMQVQGMQGQGAVYILPVYTLESHPDFQVFEQILCLVGGYCAHSGCTT